jgi:arylsulfatase A-like enzyme
MNNTTKLSVIALVLIATAISFADVRLPGVISDNIVLQQKNNAPISGRAEPGEKVTVTTSWKKTTKTTANKEGLPASAAEKPNILVILTDDVGWGDFRSYNPKSKIPSPNLDRLVKEGMRFTNAHSPAALCSPTRYSMVTGNYPWRGRNSSGTWGVNVRSHLLDGQETVATLLKTAGYRTSMFGKAGFGGFYDMKKAKPVRNGSKPLAPVRWGFDYSYLIPRGHQSPPLAFFENGVLVGEPLKGKAATYWDNRMVGQRLTEKAIAFLDSHLAQSKTEGKQRPFFMHFCTAGAHSPWTPADKLIDTPLKGVTKMTDHTDMVYETEIILGKLVEALDDRGMLANTLVVFTSDNGGLAYGRDLGHVGGGGMRWR